MGVVGRKGGDVLEEEEAVGPERGGFGVFGEGGGEEGG